eukprot:m.35018 g.35018  ORF g.35018 m.35018 type:complete len:54 (+) comp6576_c0_seq1:1998-2159(+)
MIIAGGPDGGAPLGVTGIILGFFFNKPESSAFVNRFAMIIFSDKLWTVYTTFT